MTSRAEPSGAVDLRAPVLAAVAWLAALGALHAPRGLLFLGLVVAVTRVAWRARSGRPWLTHLGWLATGVGVAGLTLLRTTAVHQSPFGALARDHAEVEVRLVATSDPVVREGRFGTYVVLRADALEVVGRGVRHRVRAPVLVLGDERWRAVPLGSTLHTRGRLEPAGSRDLSGVLSPRGPPHLVARPAAAFRAADTLRHSIRRSAAGHGAGPSALVPGLVDGDDAGMPTRLTDAFRATGLTHLLAVSGTNLTLVVGSLLLLARWIGVRARALVVVGVVGVAGFVLLARTEPSVLRAAVMGSVALLGMGANGRTRGSRALGAAVLVLLLLDPWLAQSPGFALSALATAGILWLAPGWRDRLARWVPRWVAEAVAVPLAAQLACTPLVAGMSGQVSLVAVAANLVAAPVVGPATVLGLFGGVVGLLVPGLGRLVATPAAWCAWWLVQVAQHGAALPVATVGWSSRPLGLAVLTSLCLVAALVIGPVLRRPLLTVVLGLVLVVVMLVPVPTWGWPPRGWVMVACDVGQGDGLALNAGGHAAVVVDTGPDPAAMGACLRRLGVRAIPLLVLTHFHADHVGGLAGAVAGRSVGRLEVTSLDQPAAGVRAVSEVAARHHLEIRRAAYGETGAAGPLRWQVLGPSHPPSPESDSPPNDASLVLLVETRGVRLLLLGDEEQTSQEQLWRDTGGGLRAEVLKVAHHGSAKQDPELIGGLGARLAVVSVGVDNDYGHPAPSLLALLHDDRMRVGRTDRDGDVAVVVDHGLRLVTRR